MAERKTDDDFNPRHRIVGAVILVALAVIFLPLLLQDRPSEQNGASSKEAPVTDARDVATPGSTSRPIPEIIPKPVATDPPIARPSTRTVTVPLGPIEAANPPVKKPVVDPAAPAMTSGSATTTDTTPVKSESRVEPKTEAKKEPKAVAKPEAKPKPAAGDWFVQVGVFSQADNARRLQDKLQSQKYSVVTDPPRIEKGKTIKVEVGPYKDQSSAKAAAARIKADHNIDGVVRKH